MMIKIIILTLSLLSVSTIWIKRKENSNQIIGSWWRCSDLVYEEAHFLENGLYYTCALGSPSECIKYPYTILKDSLFVEIETNTTFKGLKILKLDDDSLILEHEYDKETRYMYFVRIKQQIYFPWKKNLPNDEFENYLYEYESRFQKSKCPNNGPPPLQLGNSRPTLDDILEVDSVRDE